VEFELNGAANQRIKVSCKSSACRHLWHDADSVAFSAIFGLQMSVVCDVQDSRGCWDSATERLRTQRSPSHNGRRGCTCTSASCTQTHTSHTCHGSVINI